MSLCQIPGGVWVNPRYVESVSKIRENIVIRLASGEYEFYPAEEGMSADTLAAMLNATEEKSHEPT